MRARAILVAAPFLLPLTGTTAFACGVCIEDRIATVYDHAVVTKALGQKHHVAFFAIKGTLAPGNDSQRAIEAITESAHGVDQGSARVSLESASLSVSFDPARVQISALERDIEVRLAAKKLSLQPLRVMDGPARMKAVDRQ